jgi:hypothetical protein
MSEDRRRALTPRTDARRPRATTATRERVIAELSDRFAEGALEVEEFEHRVALAHRSESVVEIEALVADLPAAARPRTPTPATGRELVPEAQVRRRATLFAVMGGTERKGVWRVPRTMNVVALMGGAKIDLREAQLPAGLIELRVVALMGGVEIIVPPSLAVEASGAAIMGGFEHVDRAPVRPEPDAPLLRVVGLALLGGVSVEMRLPGESSREARRRRKRERRPVTSTE